MRRRIVSILSMFLCVVLLSNVAFADNGTAGYRTVYEETNYLGVVRVTVSNVHSNYMGSVHGTRNHVNVNVYVAGVECANFHVWNKGGCIYVYESKTNNTTKYCEGDLQTKVGQAFERQTGSPSLTQGITDNIPWWVVGLTAVVVIGIAAAVLLACPEAVVFLAIAA